MPKAYFVNKVFVNTTALRHNFREAKRLGGDRHIMAVIKADAYGHGLLASARTLSQAGAEALGVVEAEDAFFLLNNGLETPIHILGGVRRPEHLEAVIRLGLPVFASCPQEVRALSEKGAELGLKAKIHLKIDTGLGRRGLRADQFPTFLKEAINWPSLDILGLATQLATAGDAAAELQLEKFDSLCYIAEKLGLKNLRHSALNSSGLVCHHSHQSGLLRIGLMLYGVLPARDMGPLRPDLRPAMTVLSRVTDLHELIPGETVGLERTYMVRRPMKVAMVSFGSAQGLASSRSGRGWVLIKGRKAPQVGLIGLNHSIYDITNIPEAAVGDNVVILGRHTLDSIRAEDMAAWAGVPPGEVLTLLGRLNQRYIEGSDYEEDACE